MGRLIDADKLEFDMYTLRGSAISQSQVASAPTVEVIPREEVRQFILNIQKIKDNHNEYGEPINYGTICGILIEGYRLLNKYGTEGDDKGMKKDIDAQFLCKDCERYNLCEYYHNRKEESYICKYFHLDLSNTLDKIRAEIENDWQLKKSPCSPFSCGLRQAIEIIDKYKAESEAG